MGLISSINSGIRFLLEIVSVGIIAYSGWKVPDSKLLKIVLGLGLPIVIVLIWAKYGAPKSPDVLKGSYLLLLEIAIYFIAAFSLFRIEGMKKTLIYMVVVVINTLLLYLI